MAQYKYVRPKTTVKKILAEGGNQPMFPVVDENNRLQGYILRKDLDKYSESLTKKAEQVLKEIRDESQDSRLIYVFDSMPLDVGLNVMNKAGLQFMPVVDSNFHYVGTIDNESEKAL